MEIRRIIIPLYFVILSIECGFVEELIEVSDILMVFMREYKLRWCVHKEAHHMHCSTCIQNKNLKDFGNVDYTRLSSSSDKNNSSKSVTLGDSSKIVDINEAKNQDTPNSNDTAFLTKRFRSNDGAKIYERNSADNYATIEEKTKVEESANSEITYSSKKLEGESAKRLKNMQTELNYSNPGLSPDDAAQQNSISSGSLSHSRQEINLHLVFYLTLLYCFEELKKVKIKYDVNKYELEKFHYDLASWVANYPWRLQLQIRKIENIELRERQRNPIDREELLKLRNRLLYLRKLRYHFFENLPSIWEFKAENEDTPIRDAITRNVKKFCEIILPRKIQALRGVYSLPKNAESSPLVICELYFQLVCKNPLVLYVGIMKPGPNAYYAIGIKDDNSGTNLVDDAMVSMVDYVRVDFKTSSIEPVSEEIITSLGATSHALIRQPRNPRVYRRQP